MSDAFDPYHKWLSIPPHQQPPNHYRLLGLNGNESDPEVIANAADRLMKHLRTYQTSKRSQLSQKLLNEVVNAKICLLDQQSKAQYDAELATRSRPKKKTPKKVASAPQVEDPFSPIEIDRFDEPPPLKSTHNQLDATAPARVPEERSSQEGEGPNAHSRRVLVVAGCVGILLLLFGIGFLFRMISDNAVDEGPAGPANVANRDTGSGFSQGNSTRPRVGSAPAIPPDPASPSVVAKVAPEEENDAKERENVERTAAEDDDADTEPVNEEPPPKQPIGFVELQIAPSDTRNNFKYKRIGGGYYSAAGSTSMRFNLEISGSSGPLTGLCLEINAPAHQTATLTNMRLKSANWLGAIDSLGQGGAATVIDANTNAGWQLQFSGGDPVWAVFAAERPFGPNFLIRMEHRSNTQRLQSFRLWGITGVGTAEEMARAFRDRKRDEKPFVDFVAHGLPAGLTGEVGLGSLFLGKEKLAAQLFGGNSNPDGAQFSLEQITPAEEAASQRWQFILSGDKQTPVAELTLTENKLSLGWLPAAGELSESASLQNGLLQLRIGEHVRSVPLREVKEQAPLTYNALKTVKPQIEVPAGVPAADLRLVLQFPTQTFGVNKRLVLSLAGDEKEQGVSLRDGTILMLATSWEGSSIILKIKTLQRTGIDDKNGKKKMRDVPLKKAFTEIPDLNARIKKGEKIIETIEKAEKYADRSRIKTAEKQEIAKITRQWRTLGIPLGNISKEQMEKLRGHYEANQEKIKKRRNQLKLLQGWAEQMGDVEAIEFRVYTLVDGMPLDLVRSTGWVDD